MGLGPFACALRRCRWVRLRLRLRVRVRLRLRLSLRVGVSVSVRVGPRVGLGVICMRS